jgi:hypothetical protein
MGQPDQRSGHQRRRDVQGVRIGLQVPVEFGQAAARGDSVDGGCRDVVVEPGDVLDQVGGDPVPARVPCHSRGHAGSVPGAWFTVPLVVAAWHGAPQVSPGVVAGRWAGGVRGSGG